MVKRNEQIQNYNSTPNNYIMFIMNSLTNSKNKINN